MKEEHTNRNTKVHITHLYSRSIFCQKYCPCVKLCI